MKKLFKFFIPIIIVLTLMLVGCDGDGRNPISHKKEPVETVATEAPTESSDDEIQEQEDATQKMYEKMFEDTFTIDMNSENLILTISKEDSNVLEMEKSASGDTKNVISVGDKAKFITYSVGGDSYLEIHVSEYKDNDGEIKEAENLYYKTTNNKISSYFSSPSEDFGMNDLNESLQLATENVSSVRYLGEQDVHGTECRVVEIETETEKDDKTVNNKSFFYFSDLSTMFGGKFTTSKGTIDCYFPDNVKIELPQDVEFEEVEDAVLSQKILDLKSAGLLEID